MINTAPFDIKNLTCNKIVERYKMISFKSMRSFCIREYLSRTEKLQVSFSMKMENKVRLECKWLPLYHHSHQVWEKIFR